jgi:hypothetical protein
VKDLAAGSQDVQARGRGQQPADDRGAGHEVLEVVEHDQGLPISQEVDQRVGERPVSRVVDIEDLGDRARDESRIRDRCERDE